MKRTKVHKEIRNLLLPSAGLVLIQNNKILLVHPKNASWWGTYSIPKGRMEGNETPWQTAVRETYEEVGIEVNKNLSMGCCGEIIYPNCKKRVLYFLAYAKEPFVIDFKPNDEVDWAGFLSYERAKERIHPFFKELLQYIRHEEKIRRTL